MNSQFLTKKQQLLLAIAKEQGFLTVRTASLVYKGLKSRRNAIQRLEILGYLKMIEYGKWKYIGGVKNG